MTIQLTENNSWAVILIVFILPSCATLGSNTQDDEQNRLAPLVQRFTQCATIDIDENSNVRVFSLNLGRITSEIFSDNGEPRFLYNVDVEFSGLTPKNVDQIKSVVSKCHRIEELNFSGMKNVDSLGFVADLKELRILDLSFTYVPESEIVNLMALQNIESLFLSGNQYSASVLGTLKQLKKLRVLGLDGFQLTTDELNEFVAELDSLETLYIRGNKLFDKTQFQCVRKNLEVIYTWPKNGGGIIH